MLHSQSGENRQNYNTEHKTHMQHPITTEQSSQDQVKKGIGQLEDIFIKTVSVEHDRFSNHKQ